MTTDDLQFEAVPIVGATKKELLMATGWSARDLENLVREGLPTRDKRYDLPQIFAWLLDRNADPMDAAKRKALEATAKKRSIEAEQLDGKLVEIDVAEAALRDVRAKYQNELESVPEHCPADVRDLVREKINAAINHLAALPEL